MLKFIIHRRDGLARMTLALGMMAAAAAFALSADGRSGPRMFGTANATTSACSFSQLRDMSSRFACGDFGASRPGSSVTFLRSN